MFAYHVRSLLIASIALLCFEAAAHAQFRAGIQGNVTDPSGASISGAKVTLNSRETNQKREVTTNTDGFYNFDRLGPGRYSVSAEATGFKKQVTEDVLVSAEQTLGLNLRLEVGTATESVTVTGDMLPALQTENASVQGTISNEQILRLPQVGRDPYELVRLTPGIFGLGARGADGGSINFPNNAGPGGSNSSIFQTENQIPISANGQRITANGFEIDGVNVNSQAWGGAAVLTPNQESVKEMHVLSNAYTAEHGRTSGALVQVVSQNGTNNFHGSAVLKINEPSLNAFQRWGGPQGELPQRVMKRYRNWAGSIGGPIIKDRLFFFFSYETIRSNQNELRAQWIETPEYGQLLQQARPNSLANQIVNFPGMAQNISYLVPRNCASVNLDASNCAMLPGGLDLGSPMGSMGQTVPTPFGGGLDGIPDLRYAQLIYPSATTSQQFNGRVDYQATNNDRLGFSMYLTPNKSTFAQSARPAQDYVSDRRSIAGTVLWSRSFTPTFLNEARFNVTRWYFDEIQTNANAPWGIPRVQVNNQPFPFELNWGLPGPGVFYQTSYDFRDIATKVIGNHVLKFGGEIIREQNNDTIASGARPTYNFGNLWNFANDAAVDESGNFDPRNGFPTDLKKYIRAGTYSLFIQDDWKVRPNLTINLGLRWEYFQPLSEKYGNISNLALGPNQSNPLIDSRMTLGGTLWQPDRNNFGPQVGVAWSPTNILGKDFNNKLVLRGGFGIGYNRMTQSLTLNGRFNPPFVSAFTLTGNDILYSLGNNINSFYGWPSNPAAILQFDPNTNLPISGAAPNVFAASGTLPNPYTYRYSFDMQYDLGSNWVAAVGYQGSTTHKYPRVLAYNLLFPVPEDLNLNVVRFIQNDVNSNFNALLARVSHRFSRGFDLNVQYRFAKSIDFCSNDDNCKQSYPVDQRTERGPSDFDVTHMLTVSGLWDIPVFRDKSKWTGKLLGGWQLNGILTTSSGFPWTAVYRSPNCDPITNQGGVCPARPIAYAGGAGTDFSNGTFQQQGGNFPGDPYSYFTPPPDNDLLPPAPGIGRNTFRGPRYFSVDMSATKRFMLPKMPFFGEAAGLDIRANLFNIFNQLNLRPFEFGSGSTVINDPNFGRATAAQSGRVIEFQARFSF